MSAIDRLDVVPSAELEHVHRQRDLAAERWRLAARAKPLKREHA